MGSLQLVLISAVTQSRIMSHRQKLHSLANGLFTWTVYYLSINKKQNFWSEIFYCSARSTGTFPPDKMEIFRRFGSF